MFDSLGSRRARRRVPGWLLRWLLAMLVGAGSVLLVQQRYLPPRLSAAESAVLQRDFAQADTERRQLQAELAQTRQQLQRSESGRQAADAQLAASRSSAERLRQDLEQVVQALPRDPRGGSVEVRAGQFSGRPGTLDYGVVLVRDGNPRQPLAGVLQLNVSGDAPRGSSSTLALPPIELSLPGQQVLRGSLPLPEGFKPRQVTVQVLDKAGGRPLGMRVLLVR